VKLKAYVCVRFRCALLQSPQSTLDTAREPNALYRTRSARATASPRVRLRVPSRRPPGVRRRTAHSKTRDTTTTQTGTAPTHAGMHAGRPTRHWDGPLGVGQLASKWDDPQLGHPSQTGTPQPKWDTSAKLGQLALPPTWDVPHRVGRLNRLGRPMKVWDDPAVGHPTPSPGHTTQAGKSHTNWSIPIFSRLLRVGDRAERETRESVNRKLL